MVSFLGGFLAPVLLDAAGLLSLFCFRQFCLSVLFLLFWHSYQSMGEFSPAKATLTLCGSVEDGP